MHKYRKNKNKRGTGERELKKESSHNKLCRAVDGGEKRETRQGEDKEYCTQRGGSRRTE